MSRAERTSNNIKDVGRVNSGNFKWQNKKFERDDKHQTRPLPTIVFSILPPPHTKNWIIPNGPKEPRFWAYFA